MVRKIYFPFFLALFSLVTLSFTACDDGTDDADDTTDQVDTISTVEETPPATEVEDKSKRPSPPDSAMATVGDLTVKINYGSPRVKGRTIWGELVPYGQVWRTGANEATTFEVNQDVTINGKPVPAGKYALFTIPNQGKWTVILNKVHDQWGAFDYNEAEDLLRFTVDAKSGNELAENMNFTVNQKNESTAEIVFRWDKLKWSFDVKKA